MSFFFFFNDTATTEIYTLSLHDALPIYEFRELIERRAARYLMPDVCRANGYSETLRIARLAAAHSVAVSPHVDRKSTRLNSSHLVISYAVFCLKKKKLRTESLIALDVEI